MEVLRTGGPLVGLSYPSWSHNSSPHCQSAAQHTGFPSFVISPGYALEKEGKPATLYLDSPPPPPSSSRDFYHAHLRGVAQNFSSTHQSLAEVSFPILQLAGKTSVEKVHCAFSSAGLHSTHCPQSSNFSCLALDNTKFQNIKNTCFTNFPVSFLALSQEFVPWSLLSLSFHGAMPFPYSSCLARGSWPVHESSCDKEVTLGMETVLELTEKLEGM